MQKTGRDDYQPNETGRAVGAGPTGTPREGCTEHPARSGKSCQVPPSSAAALLHARTELLRSFSDHAPDKLAAYVELLAHEEDRLAVVAAVQVANWTKEHVARAASRESLTRLAADLRCEMARPEQAIYRLPIPQLDQHIRQLGYGRIGTTELHFDEQWIEPAGKDRKRLKDDQWRFLGALVLGDDDGLTFDDLRVVLQAPAKDKHTIYMYARDFRRRGILIHQHHGRLRLADPFRHQGPGRLV